MADPRSAPAATPADPIATFGLRKFASLLRHGSITVEATTATYLDRIAAQDGKIGAFSAVAGQQALDAARGLDAQLQRGTDLGPLMGVPIAVKEIFAVEGLRYGAGTDLNLSELVPPEGSFIRQLRQAGCVILGTTHTTEFAAATINVHRPMPWNPADPLVKRVCGGSSHGSAAALRAGMCAFSVGSDTGGSVRLPAALCGVVGFKSTAGDWPRDGVFALSTTLDSVGIFTRSVDDAAVVAEALAAPGAAPLPAPGQIRLGRPRSYVFDDLDGPVAEGTSAAIAKLTAAGIELVDVDIPDPNAFMVEFATLLFGEFVATMGAQRLRDGEASIDPVPWSRIKPAMEFTPEAVARACRTQRNAVAAAAEMMTGIDALVYPVAPFLPCPVSEVQTLDAALGWAAKSTRLTRLANLFGQCGVSIPIEPEGTLPIGLQIIGRPHDDRRLLGIASAVEGILGSKRPHH